MKIKVRKPNTDPTIVIESEVGTVMIRPGELLAARVLVLNVTPIQGEVVIEEHRAINQRRT